MTYKHKYTLNIRDRLRENQSRKTLINTGFTICFVCTIILSTRHRVRITWAVSIHFFQPTLNNYFLVTNT